MKLLKILIISVLFFCCASTLNAKVYTWTDEKGVTNYSDHPPENEEYYEIETQPRTYQDDEDADNKQTGGNQEQVQDVIKEVDENYEKQQQEEKLKAQEAEKNRPPTQEEMIAAEKEKLEKKISELEGQPLEYFGNELNKHRYTEYYRYRLETLQQDPDKYFKIPKSFKEYVKQPD